MDFTPPMQHMAYIFLLQILMASTLQALTVQAADLLETLMVFVRQAILSQDILVEIPLEFLPIVKDLETLIAQFKDINPAAINMVILAVKIMHYTQMVTQKL